MALSDPGFDEKRETIRFEGGPWDAEVARYYGVSDRPPIVAPGGRYVYELVDVAGRIRYVFRSDAAGARVVGRDR